MFAELTRTNVSVHPVPTHELHNNQPPEHEVKEWPAAKIKPKDVAWHAEGKNENAQIVATVEIGEGNKVCDKMTTLYIIAFRLRDTIVT